MEVNGQLHAPTALPSKKSPRWPLPPKRKLYRHLSRSGHFGDEKNLLPLSGIKLRFLGRLAACLIISTMSHHLQYVGYVHEENYSLRYCLSPRKYSSSVTKSYISQRTQVDSSNHERLEQTVHTFVNESARRFSAYRFRTL